MEHFLTARRVRVYAISCFAVFLTLFIYLRVTAVAGVDRMGNPLFPDFTVFHVVGERVAHGDMGKVYDQAWLVREINRIHHAPEDGGGYLFLYPPFVAWWCAPLGWVPLPLAQGFILALNLALGFGLSFWFARQMVTNDESRITIMWLFVASLPFWRTVLFGQWSQVFLAVLLGCYVCWKSQYWISAGVVLSLGLAKPQLFFGVMLWMLLFSHWRMWWGFGVGAGSWIGLGFLLRGTQGWLEWWNSIRILRGGTENAQWQHSFLNAFELWPSNHQGLLIAKFALWGILCAIYLAGLWKLWLNRSDETSAERGFVFALLGSFLLTPRIYQYDLVMTYPLFILWWQSLRVRADKREIQCYALVLGSFYFSDFFMAIKLPLLTFFGLVIFMNYYVKIIFDFRLERLMRK